MNFDFNSWHWIGFSSFLFCLELFMGSPGVILLWIGIASLCLSGFLAVFSINFWVQLIILAVLSLLLGLGGRRFFFSTKGESFNNLNQRSKNLVGTILRLEHPIKNGKSRVRINDTIWRIEGTDLIEGTQIEIIDIRNNTLIVDKIF